MWRDYNSRNRQRIIIVVIKNHLKGGNMKKVVGYMEGTNSDLLTSLIVEGYDTIPLSNGFDNHGKYVAHIMKTDNIGLVVGYLHKFLALSKELRKVGDDNLSALKAYRIPTVFIVPQSKQEKAKKLLKGKGVSFQFADPGEITKVVNGMLKSAKKGSKKK